MNKYLWIYILMLLFTACDGGGEPGTDGPVVSPDYISVSSPSLPLLGDGQQTEITISANCSWTISRDADWLTVNPSSGSNTQTVTVTANKNSSGKERTAVLTVSGGKAPSRKITVTQPKGSEELVLSANISSLAFEAKGESKSFKITSNTSWTISKPEWCSLSLESGTGDANINVTATENKEKEQRTGDIVITGKGVNPVNIRISQKEREAGQSEPGSGDNIPPQ